MLNRFEELKLVAKCTLTDDRDAFGKLVEAYQSDIRRFFLNLTGDACLSDDLAQESFIKAYISIGSFMGLARFKTWIYRIAYNEFYDWTRKRKEERLDDEESTADNEMAYDGNENDCSTRIDIANALQKLSPAEKSATVLFYMEDRPLKEIARIMEMPEGTVKSHLSRAKTKLAGLLK